MKKDDVFTFLGWVVICAAFIGFALMVMYGCAPPIALEVTTRPAATTRPAIEDMPWVDEAPWDVQEEWKEFAKQFD